MSGASVAAPRSFRAFAVLWAGQFASMTGSGLTSFGLGVYAYQRTGSVTALGLVYALAYLPFLLAAPFAGALVDRWGARRSLVYSDVMAAVTMLCFAGVLSTGTFALWQVCVVVSCLSLSEALGTPALESSIPALVSQRQVGRANGLVMLAIATSRLLAPMIAGVLLVTVGLPAIILIDCVSYVLALVSLALVRIPRVAQPEDQAPRSTRPADLLADFWQAWRYVAARRGLLVLLVFSALVNFCGAVVQLMITPLVLSFASSATLGTVMSCAGAGMLIASVVMSAWGGPQRRIAGILGFALVMGMAMVAGSLRPDPVLIAGSAFVVMACSAIVMTCNHATWQVKVEPRLRGRVLALLTMAFSAPPLLAFAVAGLMADYVFEPVVGRDEVRSDLLRMLLGTGQGRGFAFEIMVMGLLIMACVGGALLSPRLRHLETELPDAGFDPASDSDAADPSEDEESVVGVPEPITATVAHRQVTR